MVLKLKDLNVQSFVTGLKDTEIIGGRRADTSHCTEATPCPQSVDLACTYEC